MVTKRNHKMTPGCSNPDPCKSHKCLNRGKCRANPDGADYTCRCRAGYGGSHCDLGEYPSDSSYSKFCFSVAVFISLAMRLTITYASNGFGCLIEISII